MTRWEGWRIKAAREIAPKEPVQQTAQSWFQKWYNMMWERDMSERNLRPKKDEGETDV